MIATAASTARLALGMLGGIPVAPKFVYLVHTTDGHSVRVVTSGDPTQHPTFFDRVVSVETLGLEGLRLVSDPSDKVMA